MKMLGWNLRVSLGAVGTVGALVAASAVFEACSTKSATPVAVTCPAGGGSNNPSVANAGACAPTSGLTVGTEPVATCDDSAQSCPSCGACDLSMCESKATGACAPLADNAGKGKLDFRIRRLNVAAPPTLAAPFIQANVVTKAIDLNDQKCGEVGTGTFNWLLSVDMAAKTVTTGGAPPSSDPFHTGFCYANTGVLQAPGAPPVPVAPITSAITLNGNAFTSMPASSTLFVPIFLDPKDLSSVVILPIQGATLANVTISADKNCIGSENPAALDTSCHDDSSQCSKWNTDGSIGGFITLKDADTVQVALLHETLCALLTMRKDPSTGSCAADAFTKGNYCAATKAPGGCSDSFWLAATFAASAATINDGSGTAVCKAGGVIGNPDAGTPDAGAVDGSSGDAGGGNDSSAGDAAAD